jgi:hypothetical protein
MNWRWLIMDYVPPELALTRDERRAFRTRMRDLNLATSWRKEVFGFLCSAGPFIVGWWIAVQWIRPSNPALGAVVTPLLGAILTLAGVWIVLTYARASFRRRGIHAALRDLGYDTCAACGYWLRGLDEGVDRCPECGAPRAPARTD